MNISDFLPPSRVREIAKQFSPKGAPGAEAAIRAAMPEGAAAALEWAAKRCTSLCEDATGKTGETLAYFQGKNIARAECAEVLNQLAKEFRNAK